MDLMWSRIEILNDQNQYILFQILIYDFCPHTLQLHNHFVKPEYTDTTVNSIFFHTIFIFQVQYLLFPRFFICVPPTYESYLIVSTIQFTHLVFPIYIKDLGVRTHNDTHVAEANHMYPPKRSHQFFQQLHWNLSQVTTCFRAAEPARHNLSHRLGDTENCILT